MSNIFRRRLILKFAHETYYTKKKKFPQCKITQDPIILETIKLTYLI